MKTFLNEDKIQFRDLTGEQMKAVVDCKDKAEWYDTVNKYWVPVKRSDFFPSLLQIYRIPPEPLTKPKVDWSWFKEHIVAVARDSGGMLYCYDTIPVKWSSTWMKKDTCYIISNVLNIDGGTCDWEDSLVIRPDTWIEWDGREEWPGDPDVEVLVEYENGLSEVSGVNRITWVNVRRFMVIV